MSATAELTDRHLNIPKAMAAKIGVRSSRHDYEELLSDGLWWMFLGWRAWDPGKNPDGERGLLPYLCRHARWGIIHGLRRAAGTREAQAPPCGGSGELSLFDAIADHREPPPDACREEDAALIRRLLRQLGREDRLIIRLHFMEDYSLKEIGEVLGIPRWKAWRQVQYALRKMRRLSEAKA